MKKFAPVSGGVLLQLAIMLVAVVLLVSAFTTMLGLGILHAHLSNAVPALGFGDSFWVSIGVWLVSMSSKVVMSAFGDRPRAGHRSLIP